MILYIQRRSLVNNLIPSTLKKSLTKKVFVVRDGRGRVGGPEDGDHVKTNWFSLKSEQASDDAGGQNEVALLSWINCRFRPTQFVAAPGLDLDDAQDRGCDRLIPGEQVDLSQDRTATATPANRDGKACRDEPIALRDQVAPSKLFAPFAESPGMVRPGVICLMVAGTAKNSLQ
jgi:hypothetical protein